VEFARALKLHFQLRGSRPPSNLFPAPPTRGFLRPLINKPLIFHGSFPVDLFLAVIPNPCGFSGGKFIRFPLFALSRPTQNVGPEILPLFSCRKTSFSFHPFPQVGGSAVPPSPGFSPSSFAFIEILLFQNPCFNTAKRGFDPINHLLYTDTNSEAPIVIPPLSL